MRASQRTIAAAAAATTMAALVIAVPRGQNAPAGKTTIPLCPGLTIVTAVSQPQGDYESIKRIESVTPDGIRIRYSSYMRDPQLDYDSTTVAPPPLMPFVVHRTVRRVDLDASASYMQQFAPNGVPETVNGTTALGISAKSFRELKDKGRTPLTIFQAILPAIGVKDDGSSTMPGMDYRMPGELVEINESLQDEPEKVNTDPYGDGWMIRVRLSDKGGVDSMLSAAEYEDFLKAETE